MQKNILGPVDQFYLIGGGRLLFELSVWLKSQGIKGSIIAAERHAKEEVLEDDRTLEQLAKEAQIEIHIIEDINNIPDNSKRINFTDTSFALSLGAAWIFKEQTIEKLFKNRLFNLHGSRLPQYRGGGGFSWQILRGNRLGFCLIHFIDGGVDTGNILKYEEFLYPADCRIPLDYEECYRKNNLEFMQKLFKKLVKGSITFQPVAQQEYFSAYWPRLHSPTHSWIDWSMPLNELDRFICAFDDPYCGAQTTSDGSLVYLKKTMTDNNDGNFHPFQYGLVYRNNGKWLSVAANGGTIIIQSVTGKDGQDLIRSIKSGDRFFTPVEKLEEACSQRIFYTPRGLCEGRKP
ncbi:MAG: hypothetical protein GY853_11485 [PVC group bacterium]|nr:hypothetical protein [PVC group bacterium]